MVFIYWCLIIFAVFTITIIFSSIEIHIQNIKVLWNNLPKIYLNKDYKIIITLKLFSKISYFKINLAKTKLQEKKLLNKIEQRVIKNADSFKSGVLKFLKLLKLSKIKNLNLKIQIGLEDAALNAITVGIISSIIPTILKNNLKKDTSFWSVSPIYNQNLLKLKLDTTISLKIFDILFKNFEAIN